MANVSITRPAPGTPVAAGQPVTVSGRATGTGGAEPHVIDSVTVSIDGGGVIAAQVTALPHQPEPTVLFTASVAVPSAGGAHQIVVRATDDVGVTASATVLVTVAAAVPGYPQFTPTARPVLDELAAVTANRDQCSSIYLDTLESHSHYELPFGIDWEGEDHHQGLARTHQLADGSVVFFLSHSETDQGDRGNLMHFRYRGPVQGEHVLTTSPPTVAALTQLLETEEQHPCDMSFLPDVNDTDAGYLFVAEQWTLQVRVYQWSAAEGLTVHGVLPLPPFATGPNFVFVGASEGHYFAGAVPAYDGDAGTAHLLIANAASLFPGCVPGALDLSAFHPAGESAFPVANRASQVHLMTDATGQHFLLAFRASEDDDETGDDFVDVHPVSFKPFAVSPAIASVHIFLRPGKTSFASTGTHYVDRHGRLLVSSSYRWAEDEGPGGSGYVSRVDECPS